MNVARDLLAVLLLSVPWSLLPHGAMADHAQEEKCTCDAAPGLPLRNGASVPNATACWSVEDPGREWCEIVIESLEGAPARPPAPSDGGMESPSAAADLVGAQFRRFLQTYAARRGDHPMLSDLVQAERAMDTHLERQRALLDACMTEFRRTYLGRGFHRESSEGVTCQVGEETGWLRLRFAVGGFWLTYMRAPEPQ